VTNEAAQAPIRPVYTDDQVQSFKNVYDEAEEFVSFLLEAQAAHAKLQSNLKRATARLEERMDRIESQIAAFNLQGDSFDVAVAALQQQAAETVTESQAFAGRADTRSSRSSHDVLSLTQSASSRESSLD
jgi:hypothetical protein